MTPASRLDSAIAFAACFAAATASGGSSATWCASSRVRSRASPAATTSVTMPSRKASAASTRAFRSRSSFARAGPTARTSRYVPPELGTMPSSTSGRPKTAVSSATRKSVANASSKPAPRHHPEIALKVGCGSAAIRS